jgi:hypothetical protein
MAVGVRKSPYQGLIPYTVDDEPFFFGRAAERELIAANLIASRLTLLYGASGVGKTSVLQAGVVHDLQAEARGQKEAGERPEYMVVSLSTWRDDPLLRLIERLSGIARDFGLDRPPPSSALDQILAHYAGALAGGVLVILDQFEEYFLYHPAEDGEGTVAVELPRAINRADLRANFLISIRDDSIAGLDRFKGRIPSLFTNYLRIQHLDRAAAHDAIVRPLAEYQKRDGDGGYPKEVEEGLVEAVLDQVRAGQVRLGQVGGGTVNQDRSGDAERVETPYLQIVMTRLWDEEVASRSDRLSLATLTRLGGADRIVRTHLDRAMAGLSEGRQDIAAGMFHFLVTPSGTKIAHTVDDLSEYAGIPAADLAPVVTYLADAAVRVLRPVPPPPIAGAKLRYEIFHDVLAAAILDWRTRFRESPFRWRWAVCAALPPILVVGSVVITMFARRDATFSTSLAMRVLILSILVQITATAVVALRARRQRPLYGLAVATLAWLFGYAPFVFAGWWMTEPSEQTFLSDTIVEAVGFGLGAAIAGLITGTGAMILAAIENASRRWRARRSGTWTHYMPVMLGLGTFMVVFGWTAIGVIASFIAALGIDLPLDGAKRVVGLALAGGGLAAAAWTRVERPGRRLPILAVWFGWALGAFAIFSGEATGVAGGLFLQVFAASAVFLVARSTSGGADAGQRDTVERS